MKKGFISLTILAIIGVITVLSAGGTYGVYKYQKVAKENVGLKEQVETQKDNQILQLQEQLKSITTQDARYQSTSTPEENTTTEAQRLLLEEEDLSKQIEAKRVSDETARVAAQKASDEAFRVKQAKEAHVKLLADEAARVAQIIADAAAQEQRDEQAILLIERCKAQRDVKKANLWNAMLVAVDEAEWQNQNARLDALIATTPPGSVSASFLTSAAKTTDEEHEENLSIAETQMESILAESYEECLQG